MLFLLKCIHLLIELDQLTFGRSAFEASLQLSLLADDYNSEDTTLNNRT